MTDEEAVKRYISGLAKRQLEAEAEMRQGIQNLLNKPMSEHDRDALVQQIDDELFVQRESAISDEYCKEVTARHFISCSKVKKERARSAQVAYLGAVTLHFLADELRKIYPGLNEQIDRVESLDEEFYEPMRQLIHDVIRNIENNKTVKVTILG